MKFSYRQGAYSKARAYIAYCEENDYTLKINSVVYADGTTGYLIVTAGGEDRVKDWKSLMHWLAERYDDEVDAGNIKLPYDPAKVEVFHGSEVMNGKVEIVRCKDCKHRPTMPEDGEEVQDLEFPDDVCPLQCGDRCYNQEPADDWFCANGERG